MTQTYSKSTSGNVIFIILIAVALFAALSYAITSTDRDNGKVQEQAVLDASRLVQYVSSIEQAISRMRYSHGTDETQLNFANTIYQSRTGTIAYTPANNPAARNPTDFVFYAGGGGVTPVAFTSMADTSGTIPANDHTPGHLHFVVARVIGVGTDKPELVAQVERVNPAACREINKKLGINLPTGNPFTEARGPLAAKFIGNFGIPPMIYGDNAAALQGKTAFCIHTNLGGSNSNLFYIQVLLAR